MRVIILAAGESRRFQQEGITMPKPFVKIEWRGCAQTMLEHSVGSVPLGAQISVAVPPKWANAAAHIVRKDNVTVHEVYSKGPADSALQVMEKQKHEPGPTLILDVDVLNFTNDLARLYKIMNCGVLVSWSANPAFSYVEQLGQFDKISEKKRISEFAIRGAYFVSELARIRFMDVASEMVRKEKEPYISHVFNGLGESKFAMQTSYTPIEWGTPRDIRISGAHILTGKENHARDPVY